MEAGSKLRSMLKDCQGSLELISQITSMLGLVLFELKRWLEATIDRWAVVLPARVLGHGRAGY
jgi:hypothetical protein